jgi:hypothetical protein
MEYYSALKKKEIPRSMTTWMNHEDSRLSVISQSQKDMRGNSYEQSEILKLIEAECWAGGMESYY